MIYQTDSVLFRSFLKASSNKVNLSSGPGVKDAKAKGSDGKYQGE